jgi:hypothetical protein
MSHFLLSKQDHLVCADEMTISMIFSFDGLHPSDFGVVANGKNSAKVDLGKSLGRATIFKADGMHIRNKGHFKDQYVVYYYFPINGFREVRNELLMHGYTSNDLSVPYGPDNLISPHLLKAPHQNKIQKIIHQILPKIIVRKLRDFQPLILDALEKALVTQPQSDESQRKFDRVCFALGRTEIACDRVTPPGFDFGRMPEVASCLSRDVIAKFDGCYVDHKGNQIPWALYNGDDAVRNKVLDYRGEDVVAGYYAELKDRSEIVLYCKSLAFPVPNGNGAALALQRAERRYHSASSLRKTLIKCNLSALQNTGDATPTYNINSFETSDELGRLLSGLYKHHVEWLYARFSAVPFLSNPVVRKILATWIRDAHPWNSDLMIEALLDNGVIDLNNEDHGFAYEPAVKNAWRKGLLCKPRGNNCKVFSINWDYIENALKQSGLPYAAKLIQEYEEKAEKSVADYIPRPRKTKTIVAGSAQEHIE